jgi:hypothetical protein
VVHEPHWGLQWSRLRHRRGCRQGSPQTPSLPIAVGAGPSRRQISGRDSPHPYRRHPQTKLRMQAAVPRHPLPRGAAGPVAETSALKRMRRPCYRRDCGLWSRHVPSTRGWLPGAQRAGLRASYKIRALEMRLSFRHRHFSRRLEAEATRNQRCPSRASQPDLCEDAQVRGKEVSHRRQLLPGLRGLRLSLKPTERLLHAVLAARRGPANRTLRDGVTVPMWLQHLSAGKDGQRERPFRRCPMTLLAVMTMPSGA